jgi:hypothetical protein
LAVSSLVIIWFAHNGRFVAQVLVLFVLIVLVIIVVRISRRWRYRVADNRGGAPLDQTGGSGRMPAMPGGGMGGMGGMDY